jgi:hypothetical protein
VLLHIAGTKEEKWLGDGVEGEMKQHPEGSEHAAESQSEDHDSAMIDAGVRQKPAETSLDQHERNGNSDRQETEDDEQPRRESGSQAGAGKRVETNEGLYSTVQHGAGEHGCNGHRSFTVGVRLPGVHGCNPRLGSVA